MSTPSRIGTWVAAARLRTLPAAIVPVVVGTAVARACGHIAWGPALAALAGAIAIQIGTNFANDVFDAEKGADGPDRVGPLRVVSAGLVSTSAMKRAMVLAFAVAIALGLYLVSVAGWPIIAIGIASILSGIAYTGGPWPLGYHGLGDVFVLVFFGFVAVCGTTYVQLDRVPALAVWASVPVGALATAILVVNNVRDRLGDARVGKRTLAVRFGRRAALVEYMVLLALAFLVPLIICFEGLRTAALPLLLTPLAVMRTTSLVAAVTGPSAGGPSLECEAGPQDADRPRSVQVGAEHNRLLAATAQLLLLHGALFAAGIALG